MRGNGAGDHAILAVSPLRWIGLRGSVVLSGYASPIYDSALAGWRRIEMSATGDRQTKRREVLWCNFDDVTPLFAAQPAGRMAQ